MKTSLKLKSRQPPEGLAHVLALYAVMNEKLLELAAAVAEYAASDRFALRTINRVNPAMGMALLNRLNLIGQGKYHPRLINPLTPAEVMLSKMPYEDQVEAIDNKGTTPVSTLHEDGKPGPVLLLPTLSLTADQTHQVSFKTAAGDQIWRAQDDQPAWLIDHRTNLNTRASRPGSAKYCVKNGLVWVGKKHFTPAELIAAANEAMNPPPAVDV